MGVVFVDRAPQIIAALREQVARGINNAANFWVEEAATHAPVDTGFLKSGIGQSETASAVNLSAIVRSIAPYSGFVNFGHHTRSGSYVPANPYWTNAFLMTRQKFSDFIYGKAQGAGRGVIKAALTEFHGVMGRKGRGF